MTRTKKNPAKKVPSAIESKVADIVNTQPQPIEQMTSVTEPTTNENELKSEESIPDRPILTLKSNAQPESETLPNSQNTTPETTLAQSHVVTMPMITWHQAQGTWHSIGEAVVGLQHRDKQLPCQDAVSCSDSPRVCLVVCDGAGSAAVSELGANAVAIGIQRLIHSLEEEWADLLDYADEINQDLLRRHVRVLLRHAKGLLVDLVQQHRREIRDFRCTLLVLIVGKSRMCWLKVGDGALVVEKIQSTKNEAGEAILTPFLHSLGLVGKGEFANQTTFIDSHLTMSDVQFGVEDSTNMTGLAAMSDGAAEKLVATNGQKVSGQISQWFNDLRLQKLARRDLSKMFYSESFVRGSTGDDCSIALAAKALQ